MLDQTVLGICGETNRTKHCLKDVIGVCYRLDLYNNHHLPRVGHKPQQAPLYFLARSMPIHPTNAIPMPDTKSCGVRLLDAHQHAVLTMGQVS